MRTSRTRTGDDIVEVGALRGTSPARTAADLAAVLTVPALRSAVIEALQRRVLTLDELTTMLAGMPRSVARARLRQVTGGLTSAPVDSPFEWEVVAAVTERGLRPVTGFPWRCPDGRIIHLDLAFPGAWVAVECDGRVAAPTADRPPARPADCRCSRCARRAPAPR